MVLWYRLDYVFLHCSFIISTLTKGIVYHFQAPIKCLVLLSPMVSIGKLRTCFKHFCLKTNGM